MAESSTDTDVFDSTDDLAAALAEQLSLADEDDDSSTDDQPAAAAYVGAEWRIASHGFVKLQLSPTSLEMQIEHDVQPDRMDSRARVVPNAGERDFLQSLARARERIVRLSADEHVALCQRAREADVEQLLQVHHERLQQHQTRDRKHQHVALVTVRGCLLRLAQLQLFNHQHGGDGELVVSVQYRSEPRALIMVHSNPRVQEMLYPVEWYTRDRASGHLIGALIPMQLKATRDYSPSEFMRVMSLERPQRPWLYWAEVDGRDAASGEPVEVKTRINFKPSQIDRLENDAIKVAVQSMLADVASVWYVSHFRNRVEHFDRLTVPPPSRTGQYRASIANNVLSAHRVQSLPARMLLFLDAVDDLVARLIEHAGRAENIDKIFHVTVRPAAAPGPNGEMAFSFNDADFRESQPVWRVRGAGREQ